jgi:hypothetical protein
MTDPEWGLSRGEVVLVMNAHHPTEDTRGRVRCAAAGCREWPCTVSRLVRYWWAAELGE